ncbi:MAG: triose-phosphate isomerase [Candidatus Actinomarina sp.]|tara:strand:- start:4056 stop:4820 length:765 start_codon:yes stop_codon:yes gene_type:complete
MKKIIIGNWKLNLDHLEAIQLLQKINYSLPEDIEENIEIVLSPSFTSLRSLQTVISSDKLKIKLSSQNVSQYSSGAYTGEISAAQLKKLDIEYAIVGHSERRTLFNEVDSVINDKVNRLIDSEIVPIFCFGESIDERKSGTYLNFIENQINEGLKGLRKDKVKKLVVAYEPIWAIGTGEVASLENIVEVLDYVKNIINKKPFFNDDNIKFIYGGSVSPDNAEDILNSKIVDGALVGGASLDPNKFLDIIKAVEL